MGCMHLTLIRKFSNFKYHADELDWAFFMKQNFLSCFKHYSNLMDSDMARQPGSLYHIKDAFRFRGINIAEPSQSVHKLSLQQMVSSWACTCIWKWCVFFGETAKVLSYPKNGSDKEKCEFMLQTSLRMVQAIHPDTKDYQSKGIAEGARKTFCKCKKNKGKTAYWSLTKWDAFNANNTC